MEIKIHDLNIQNQEIQDKIKIKVVEINQFDIRNAYQNIFPKNPSQKSSKKA